MKKPVILFPVVSLLSFTIVLFGLANPAKKKINNLISQKDFAVIELFTSEGCSSCPSADAVVADLAKDYASSIFVLGFHVDYWNHLGWKDAFSSAAYSNRQRQYAAAFELRSIYTPQVIINGKTQFTGSDKSRLYSSVEKELKDSGAVLVELAATAAGTEEVSVTYKTISDKNTVLNIVLVQLKAGSAVKRGENRGVQLNHINVVRHFKTVNTGTGSITIPLPDGLAAKNCKVMAFVQNRRNMHIDGAAESVIL